MTASYPRRPRFFAYRFCRVMAKVCLANEIGPEACWLLAVVANTEDAKGYREAVTFFNGQLMPLVGCKTDDALHRIRSKAVAAGWLNYQPGGKGKPGRYWVEMPERHRDWDDAPSDEWEGKYAADPAASAGYPPAKTRQEAREKPSGSAEQSEGEVRQEAREKPSGSAEHSSLSLSLSLAQHTPPPPAGPGRASEPAAEPNAAPKIGPAPEAVAAHWNAQPGLVPFVAANVHRERIIRQWAIGNPLWVEHWHAAIAFVGRTPFYCGAGDRGWRADLGWLLKTDNFASVVERMLAAGPATTTSTHHGAHPGSGTGAALGGHRVESPPGKYPRPAGDGLQTRRPPPAAEGRPAEPPAGTDVAARGSADGGAGADAGAAAVAAVPLEPGAGDGQDERGARAS